MSTTDKSPQNTNGACRIHVAFATDDNYAPYVAVAIQSIINTLAADTHCRIYILTDGLTAENEAALVGMGCAGVGVSIVDVSAKMQEASTFGLNCLTQSTYYRIYLDELLPDLDKIIYLDCDILVCKDLSELWRVDIGDAYLGACMDLGFRLPLPDKYKEGEQVLLKEGVSFDHYFNAGVLVMNLAAIRRNNMRERFIALSKRQDFILQDQDVLNVACKGHWVVLPQEWNWHFSNGNIYSKEIPRKPGDPEKAAIAHFACFKPWDMYYSPYARAWWETAFTCPYGAVLRKRLEESPAESLIEKLYAKALSVLKHCSFLSPALAARAKGKHSLLSRIMPFRKLRKQLLQR